MPYALTPFAESQRRYASKTWCLIWRIARRDGFVLRLTSHDRILTHDGEQYQPAVLGSMQQERRESGLKESSVEAQGLIDGDWLTIPDLKAARYKGAEVRQKVIDWVTPWTVYQEAVRWISDIRDDGQRFVALLESRVARLQQTTGGSRGGIFKPTCHYVLGDPRTCKKDISGDTFADVSVTTVVDPRGIVEFDNSVWTGSYADGYYRDGEAEWTVGDNAGLVSPILYHIHSSRRVTLLFPARRPIQVGDEATIRPGCDGLATTCHSKFNNILNHGGSPYDPGAGFVLEPPANG